MKHALTASLAILLICPAVIAAQTWTPQQKAVWSAVIAGLLTSPF